MPGILAMSDEGQLGLDEAHWEQFWAHTTHWQRYCYDVELRGILEPDPTKTMLEVGCYPGGYLVGFHRRYGYKVAGVDFVPSVLDLKERFESSGIKDAELYCADFFEFDPGKTYDIVSSFGFVEHFDNVDEVVRRHVELTTPGGIVIIAVPNMQYVQFLVNWLNDRRLLATHNLRVTNREGLRRTMEAAGLEVLHCNYAQTFQICILTDGRGAGAFIRRCLMGVSRRIDRLLERVGLGHIPNRFFSPAVLAVGRKPTK